MANILFITYHDFSSNSAIQIHNFANTLVKTGNDCCIAVPSNKESVKNFMGGDIRYIPLNYADLDETKLFPNGNGPDIIHAWTPREIVRKQCILSLKKFNCKLIIHLEDNEELLLENALGISIDILKTYPPEKLNACVPDSLSHPFFYKDFINLADGVTMIMDKLIDFVPHDKKHLILWPGVDSSRFEPSQVNEDLKRKWGISKKELVLCYTGNVHFANAKEVRSLYLAVAILNREGIPTKLIRAGKDFTNFLGGDAEWAHRHSIELGFLPNKKIPELLNIADILVQPGKSDRFNEYRLPSKLPEFFIMEKPIILPKANVGRFIQDYQEGLLLEKGDALDIVNKIKLIVADKELYKRLSHGGHLFALRMFDLDTNTKKLDAFYKTILNPQKTMKFH
ncbi:MAG: glycosyltransferase family 4 protein [Methanoregula sp.]|jgi:glycosyltransferase involved in cell wall biosynthesis|uniref:glycosyltransferase family 4 protein n=1 Tax=Methanoregula sp. TaxID=2052170 RepID=UPI003D12C772